MIDRIVSSSFPLGDICKELIFGVVITKNFDKIVSTKHSRGYKRFLEGRDIGRYHIKGSHKFLNYTKKLLHRARTPEIFLAKEKLLIQRITGGDRPLNAAYDDSQYFNKESINNLILDDKTRFNIKFVLGILNSDLMSWFYRNEFTNNSTLTVNLSKEYLSQIPIKTLDFMKSGELRVHDEVVSLVDQLIPLTTLLIKQAPGHSRKALERQVSALDSKLNNLIYQIYKLSQSEIRVVSST